MDDELFWLEYRLVRERILDSGGDCRQLGRYSFLGSDPFLVFRHLGGRNEIIGEDGTEAVPGNPFDVLKVLFSAFRLITPADYPPFVGGAVGYFAYDLKHFIEKLPPPPAGEDDTPLCFLAFYDTIIIFDHLQDRVFVSSTGLPEQRAHYKRLRAQMRCERLCRTLNAAAARSMSRSTVRWVRHVRRPTKIWCDSSSRTPACRRPSRTPSGLVQPCWPGRCAPALSTRAMLNSVRLWIWAPARASISAESA